MICPYQDKLIGLVAGQLTAQARDDVLAHLATCSSCAAEAAELRATWDTLGEWQIEPPARDLAPAVLAAARSSGRFAQFGRMAAAVVLAAGAGIAAALIAPAPSIQVAARNTEQVQPSADELTRAMALDSLASDPTAFTDLFDIQSADEEGKL